MPHATWTARPGLGAVLIAALLPALAAAPARDGRVETLRSRGALPVHVAGAFQEPVAFQQARSGAYYVFDRRAHAVYRVDAGRTAAERIVEIGHEEGRILEPGAFDLEPAGTFVVADAPNYIERVQIFGPGGARLGGFSLPGRAAPRLAIGGVVLSGVGSIQFTGRSILVNQPETGALVTEYALSGGAVRTFGTLRATGHEQDRDVHLALNSGLPIVNPLGGFYFVFQAGAPAFRKYDRAGRLIFERHIQGRELDEVLAAQPTAWPRRRVADWRELPVIPPLVRAAAADPRGHLWLSFMVPYTYVYDPDGEKVRTVQFQAAGLLAPTSLFFASPTRLLLTPGCYEFEVW